MFRMKVGQVVPAAARVCAMPPAPVFATADPYNHDDMRHLLASVGGVAWGITNGARSQRQGHGWRCSLLGCRAAHGAAQAA